MRKITKLAAQALRDKKEFKGSNTTVNYGAGLTQVTMRLHGNSIAVYDYDEQTLTLSDCGWTSNTTKERLNGILEVWGFKGGISQKDFEWYFVETDVKRIKDESAWNGERLEFTEVLREKWLGTKVFKVGK